MDMRIALCVVAAVTVVAVEARSPPVPQCLILCPNGFVPGSQCVCNEEPTVFPCDLKDCGINERCVVNDNTAVCIPRTPLVPQCRKYCPYGFVPGTRCECNVRPRFLCALKRCKLGERCVVHGARPICVPRRPSKVCYQPKEVGRCLAYFVRYFYNTETRRCELFVYGGCGANGNNFETIEECNTTCPSIPHPTPYHGRET